MKRILLIFISLCWIPLMLHAQVILDFHPDNELVPRLLAARKPVMYEDGTTGKPSWTLLHFSDLHGCAENLERIVAFRNRYGAYIDDALHTGDSVTGEMADGNPWDVVEGAGVLMNTVGNHDARIGPEESASQEESYRLLMDSYVEGWGVVQPEGVRKKGSPHFTACYYYKDYPLSGIRLVVLDGMHYSKAQEAWFEDCLSDALAQGLLVVAASHFPPRKGLLPLVSGFTERNEPLEEETEHRLSDSAFAIVDTFLDQGGTFVCWLGGHAPQDFIGPVRGHERQFQILVDKAGWPDWFMEEDRTRGTAFQDSFNLLTVNPGRGIFVIDRIGCTRDQYLRGKHLFVYDYRNREVIVNE